MKKIEEIVELAYKNNKTNWYEKIQLEMTLQDLQILKREASKTRKAKVRG